MMVGRSTIPKALAVCSVLSATTTAHGQDTHAPVEHQRWRLAVQTEGAFGVSPGSFYNHLAGGRADFRFTPELSVGAYAGYANLKAPDGGRAHNVLSYLLLDYRAELSDEWSIPLRLATGYLPNNGPLLRLSAGLSYALSRDVELTFELLAPTFWVVDNRTVVSFDLAAEAAYLID